MLATSECRSELHERDTKMEGIFQGHMDTCAKLGEEISDLRYAIRSESSKHEKNIQKVVKDTEPVKEQLNYLRDQVSRSINKNMELL